MFEGLKEFCILGHSEENQLMVLGSPVRITDLRQSTGQKWVTVRTLGWGNMTRSRGINSCDIMEQDQTSHTSEGTVWAIQWWEKERKIPEPCGPHSACGSPYTHHAGKDPEASCKGKKVREDSVEGRNNCVWYLINWFLLPNILKIKRSWVIFIWPTLFFPASRTRLQRICEIKWQRQLTFFFNSWIYIEFYYMSKTLNYRIF